MNGGTGELVNAVNVRPFSSSPVRQLLVDTVQCHPMYALVLLLHSWLRWVVVLAGLFAIVRAVSGIAQKRGWGAMDDRAGLIFTIALDLQMLLGLVLYFLLSPLTRAALGDFGAAMGDSLLRFWAVEHVFGVVVGIVLAHRGRSRVRAATDPLKKHRIAAIFFGLALIAILASIPWPGMPAGRPLLRW